MKSVANYYNCSIYFPNERFLASNEKLGKLCESVQILSNILSVVHHSPNRRESFARVSRVEGRDRSLNGFGNP